MSRGLSPNSYFLHHQPSPHHRLLHGLVGRMAKFGQILSGIKDMAGVLTPQAGYELVSCIKDKVDYLWKSTPMQLAGFLR